MFRANHVVRASRFIRPNRFAAQDVLQHVRFSSSEVDNTDPGPGFIDKFKLWDATRWVPLSIAGFGIATATGMYHWNEESQLLGIFALFAGTCYAQGAPLGKMLDDGSDAMLKEHHAIEDKMIDATKEVKEAHEMNADIDADLAAVLDAQKALIAEIAVAKANKRKHLFRTKLIGDLDALIELDEMNSARMQRDMVNQATEQVLSSFSGAEGGALKGAAMKSALAALKDPKSAPANIVGELYTKAFAETRARVEANAGKEVKLSAEQQASAMETVRATLSKRNYAATPEAITTVQM
jgi:hypothetical protein